MTLGIAAYIQDVTVSARAGLIEQEEAKLLKLMKEIYGDDDYLGPEYDIETTTYKVGTFDKMESKFDRDGWE